MRTASITLIKGDSYVNTLPITNADGTAYDLTGASLWLTIKTKADTGATDDDALIQLEVGTGLTVAAPLTGIVAVEITDEDTELLDPGTQYRYDVQLRKSGRTFTPIGGPLVVSRDVTRS